MIREPRFAEIAADRRERHAGLVAQLARSRREPVLLDVPDDELRSFFGEPLCDEAAEPLLWEQDVGGSNPLAPTTAETHRPLSDIAWSLADRWRMRGFSDRQRRRCSRGGR